MLTRLLYKLHRWGGTALALFMALWFISGLVIAYGGIVTVNRTQQLAHTQSLNLESGWLSLGDAWQRSAEARQTLNRQAAEQAGNGRQGGGQRAGGAMQGGAMQAGAMQGGGGGAVIASARLLRIGDEPHWLVEDGQGRTFAISALDGGLHQFSAEQAQSIGRQWLQADAGAQAGPLPAVTYVDTRDTTSRGNYQTLKPFHRLAVDDGVGTELLISARSGEVVETGNRFDRAFYLTGNWLHTFRFLDSLGFGESRRDVLLWSVSISAIAGLTGLIIGWLRWRPGLGGRPTYAGGRTQPYRTFWLKWHFWSGLIGGTAALLWSIGGIFSGNPWDIFSAAAATRGEVARYQGGELPSVIKTWSPQALPSVTAGTDVVELGWSRLGDQAVLLAYGRDGSRLPQAIDGTETQFSQPALVAAAKRLGNGAEVASQTLRQDYDSYYYPGRRPGTADRPLPVLQVELADAGHTHLYLDPQDGRLLLKQDASRRAYRWLFSATHFWDIGWLRIRPLWDAWFLTWVGFGLVLSVSSVVLGWRYLRRLSGAGARKALPSPELATASTES